MISFQKKVFLFVGRCIMMIKLYSFSFKKGGAAIAANKFLFLAKRIALSFGFEGVVPVSQDHAGVWQFLKRCENFQFTFPSGWK